MPLGSLSVPSQIRKFPFCKNSFNYFFCAQQEDVFALEAAELGNLFKVKLRHDNSNFSPSWFVDRVEIRDLETDKLYPFICERWLSKKKEEGKIQRTLYVKGYEVYLLNETSLKNLIYAHDIVR